MKAQILSDPHVFGSSVAASAAFALLAQAPPMLAGYALVAAVVAGFPGIPRTGVH